MSVAVNLNNSAFLVHEVGELSWGNDTTNYLVAISTGTLQKNGANFALTAEGDFGGTAGLKLLYAKSQSAGIASGGVLRLSHTDSIAYRNLAGSGDLLLTPNAASNALQFNSIDLVDVSSLKRSPIKHYQARLISELWLLESGKAPQ